MSQLALLQATKTRLQDRLKMSDSKLDIMHDGQPPPKCGQEFIAVHEGEWRADPADIDYGLTEYFGVKVTVTRRIGQYPIDQVGSELINKEARGMDPRLREIIKYMHQEYENLMNEANDLIPDTEWGFCEPLWFQGAEGPPRLVGGSWFYAEMGQGGREECGVVRTLVFGGAKRVQSISTLG